MGKRIDRLANSPCKKCGKENECLMKTIKAPILSNIVDVIFGDMERDYHTCPIYISLTCPEMIEEDD